MDKAVAIPEDALTTINDEVRPPSLCISLAFFLSLSILPLSISTFSPSVSASASACVCVCVCACMALCMARVPVSPPTVRQLAKLSSLEKNSAEFNMTRNYLDWLTLMPWGVTTEENFDISYAKEVLDDDHYGLEEV